jgi:MFS family permease
LVVDAGPLGDELGRRPLLLACLAISSAAAGIGLLVDDRAR